MSKKDLKSRIVKVCEARYSFAPSKKNIILLEASGDGKYILFRVVSSRNDSHAEYQIDGWHIRQTLASAGD